MSKEVLTVDELLALLSKQVLVRATIHAGLIRYETKEDIPRTCRIDKLPSSEKPPITIIHIIGLYKDHEENIVSIGKILYDDIGGDWHNANFLPTQYPIQNNNVRQAYDKVLDTLKFPGWDKPQPACANWEFQPLVISELLNPEKRGRTHCITLDPHDSRLMVHYAYISGRLKEYMIQTKQYCWATINDRFNGFIRAGLPKLIK
ncbi:MAG: hypothetical protein V1668_01515 [Patescibacteria group bacterium]